MILLLAAGLALILHVLLGWQWSIVGGLVPGLIMRRFGWAVGAAGVALGWLILVVYNFATAPHEMARFVEITAGLLGNMPGPMLVLTTIALGATLGLLGGVIGSQLRGIFETIRRPAPVSVAAAPEPEPQANNDL